MDYDKRSIGKRLKIARISAGYNTARDFTQKFNTPSSTYSNHENGKVEMKSSELAKYCRILEVSADWLLFGKGKPPTPKIT